MFFISSKKFFSFPSFQFFVFPLSPLFPQSAIALEDDRRHCLDKNFLTHFVEKEKRWHWKFVKWQSIKYGTFLWKTHAQNVYKKLFPDPF